MIQPEVNLPAKKAFRQSVKRAQRNRSVRSAMRTGVNKALRSMESGDRDEAAPVVTQAAGLLDQAVRKGIMHRKTASRRKSRLAIRLNKMSEAAAS
ncbi:MAG: 30S ribosomal protein S20 [Chloroflexi bacterium]|nr:30S ribosomal protein S20 [Chloroflexota bacterium]